MCKLFNRKYFKDDLECIEEIKKTALQSNLGKVDAYSGAIRKYLEGTGKQIDSHFSDLGKDYFIVMTYYSYLIKDSRLRRISEPINEEVKIKTRKKREFAKQLIQWYETKWEKEGAFSLIPKSLESHNPKDKPRKYLLKLTDNGKNNVSQVETIDISCCYKNSKEWEKLFPIIYNGSNNFDSVLCQIEKEKLLDNEACEENMAKLGLDKEKDINQFIPFVMAWYPLIKDWPYQYYIPSPMLSETPVGGLVVGTKTILNEDDIDNLEDIALKVTVDINFIEHKEKIKQETIKHGTKAAMTAIMSRNLSHNIGSHVISYHAQTIEDNRQQERELYQYIQHRMDFLAEITTSGPTWEMSFDFETDIMKELYEQKILLGKICRSEGININNRTFKLEIESKCKRVSIPNGMVGKHAFYSIMENFLRNSAKHHKSSKDFSVLIELKVPNYLPLSNKPTINGTLENKCEWINNGNYLRFKTEKNNWDFLTDDEINSMFPENGDDKNKLMNFRNKQRLLIELRIWDNREGSCGTTTVKDEKNNDKTISVVEKLRKFITGDDARLIKDDGDIKPEGWGIKEMRISASFLRKIGAEALLESKERDFPLMDVLCGDPNANEFLCKNGEEIASLPNNCSFVNDYKKRLCFRFYLRRPKDMLVIGDNLKVKENNNFELEWSKKDALFLDDVKTLKDEVPHRIMMVKEEDRTLFSESPFAPCRIVTYNNTPPEIKDDNYLKTYEEDFIKKIYNKNNSDLPRLTYQGTQSTTPYLFATANGMRGVVPQCIPKHIQIYFKTNSENKEWKWEDNEIDNLTDCILFYYHANENSEKTRLTELVQNKINVQPVSGGYSTMRKLEALKDLLPVYQKHFTLELIESALTRVVIVDERGSEWAKKSFIDDILRTDVLTNMNLFIVDIDTKNIETSNITEKIKSLELSNNPAHFFVIHQGILDKFEEKKAGSSEQFMNDIKDMSSWKVVDSGRGVPTKLLEGVRFVEISALLKMIMEFDKHALVQTLFSLRRPK